MASVVQACTPTGTVEAVADKVVKKENYIDDWSSVEADARHCRSLEPSSSANVSQPHVSDEDCWLELSEKEQCLVPTSGDLSTRASSRCSSAGDSPASSLHEVEVHHTFVHFKAISEEVDERVVQSMPHGMFRRCLLAESLAVESALAPMSRNVANVASDLAPPQGVASSAPGNDILEGGTEVVLHGLAKCAAFNGLRGTVQSFDADACRYDVLLEANISGQKWAKVKRDNIQLLLRVPPAGVASGLRHE